MRAPPELLTLPNELLLQIIQHLPRHDVFFGVAHANRRLRDFVHRNLRSLQLFDAHCFVYVSDDRPTCKFREDGTDPAISYSFTIFDHTAPEFTQRHRLCLRGNDERYRGLHLSHRNDSTMKAQFDQIGGQYDISIGARTARTLLSYMKIQAMRFEVRKYCKKESIRPVDDFFFDCIRLCERLCFRVELKSLMLSSKNVIFPWLMGHKSLLRLSQLDTLRTLILENMLTFEPFLKLPTRNLQSLQFRLDPRHRLEVDQLTFSPINGALLKSLAASAVCKIDFSAYSEVSQIVSSIDAVDMCNFVENWHFATHPWIIRGISFNSTVTIDEFKQTALKTLPSNFAVPVPYCRFQTRHRNSKSAVLELACYANGNTTQWIIRTGYSIELV